ncbi:MAG: MFS transporter [Planctomycetota bacterium]|jgi:MFS family permease|nr:MFS transporter [Planctomycetota bacterium]
MNINQDGIAPNAGRLLWAGFMAILAAGVGFGVRGGILATWGADFGFTGQQLGAIGGAGFTGFCFGIILGGVACDRLGYGKLVIAAFLCHVISAFVTLGATQGQDMSTAYNLLYWGTFIFAYANGTLEAVANPLVATLFPGKRTHYLNILHASWPAGLVLGGMIGWWLGEGGALGLDLGWKTQLALFLVPTVIYGLMFLGQNMPKSEASQQGLSLGEMFKDVGILGALVICYLLALFFSGAVGLSNAWSYGLAGTLLLMVAWITQFSLGAWILFTLFVAHALVGAVELGTDGWAQNITGNLLTPTEGKILFVFTSLVMFSLRFCADWIERRLGLSPVGLLVVCSILACVGLNLVSTIDTFMGAMLALTIYAVGKTFFWPTMLAIVSDRYPRTGAVAISIMGGIGMMSAGLIGATGLGYAKDRFAGAALEAANPAVYAEYKAEKPSQFLIFAEANGLDGAKLGEVQGKLAAARKELEAAGQGDPKAAIEKLSPDEQAVHAASIEGDRQTLVADSAIPATMAVIYLLLLLYFKSIGGYKAVRIEDEA